MGRASNHQKPEGFSRLPDFHESVSAIYLDVDLASPTRTCLKYLYPLLEPGGALFSQDGHLPLVIDVFHDDEFRVNEVGCAKPKVFGIGRPKLIKIVKEKSQAFVTKSSCPERSSSRRSGRSAIRRARSNWALSLVTNGP